MYLSTKTKLFKVKSKSFLDRKMSTTKFHSSAPEARFVGNLDQMEKK